MEGNAAPFRAGYVALLGKPNAGKSTLLNALVGLKLAAVSPLPQTTRDRLTGIHTDDARQIIFVDLPGMVDASDRLNECLRENVLEGVREADAILHLVDVDDPEPVTPDLRVVLLQGRVPVVLAVTKLDGKRSSVDPACWVGERLPPDLRARYRAVVGVSATGRKGLDGLLAALTELLPESPLLFDAEQTTDRDLRYLAGEAIREKAFLFLQNELPYAIAVQIEEFREQAGEKWFISASIIVERESQKGIVIGAKGDMLRRIGSAARRDIEELCEAPVFLELYVKVRERWRQNDLMLRQFGLRPPKPPKAPRGKGRPR